MTKEELGKFINNARSQAIQNTKALIKKIKKNFTKEEILEIFKNAITNNNKLSKIYMNEILKLQEEIKNEKQTLRN